MKKVKDNFSVLSEGYSKFRPIYPSALYNEILKHVETFGTCWDCATGNGQMALQLAQNFDAVVATDISQQQLDKAPPVSNIRYLQSRAEETPFADNTFDLITVGQAIHWFDFDAFNAEAKRVAKPGAVLAVIGYGLMFADPKFDQQLLKFYDGTIGAYWDPERKHIDSHYTSIPFPFELLPCSQNFSIDVSWNLNQLEGYLNTWSSVNRFIKQNGINPVSEFISELKDSDVWKQTEVKDIRFPLFLMLGRI